MMFSTAVLVWLLLTPSVVVPSEKPKPAAPSCERCDQSDNTSCGGVPTRCAKTGNTYCCVR